MTEHRITWWARGAGEPIRRTRHMNGKDWGWDATCTCGWQTRTGGAIQARIRDAIWWHRWELEHGFAEDPASSDPAS
jgi:hypothetical protein